jgi:integrase/recombinase XerD
MKVEKLVDDNPAASIHSPKQIKKSPLFLTEKEIGSLMDMPDKKTFKGARDSAILELMYSSGIKVSELINIKTCEVNTNLNIISIRGTKERLVPLSNTSKEALNLYLENFRSKKSREDNQYLFINISGEPISRQGIWKILKYYVEKMNTSKELSPQILRNSFAVHLLSHGADLGSVQELMGLSSLAATQNYLQSLEFKCLDVFRKTFPRG